MSDIPFVECLVRDTLGQLETELRLVGYGYGVGEIRGITRVVIIVAVVAQQCIDAAALPIEGSCAKGTARLDEALLTGGVDELLDGVREVDVGH